MNREIKFRGKDEQGRWWKGDLRHTMMELGKPHCRIVNVDKDDYDRLQEIWSDPVQEDTIGQFTGLFDRNEAEIYEGDILRSCFNDTEEPLVYEVIFDHGEFKRRYNKVTTCICPTHLFWEVIGNIHDNPELLKGGEK